MNYIPHHHGETAETLACQFCQKQGLQIQTRNYRCAVGEIDIIAKQNNVMIFIEVRYRKSTYFCDTIETVTPTKQARIARAALAYCQHHCLKNIDYRFDVITLTGRQGRLSPLTDCHIEWYQDAFTAENLVYF